MEGVKSDLKSQVEDLNQKLREMEVSRDDEKSKKEALEIDLVGLCKEQKEILDDNETLKAEVQKGVEDIAKALGD